MGFKITLTVVCLAISYCLVESATNYGLTRGRNTQRSGNEVQTYVQTYNLNAGNVDTRQANVETEVDESGWFNLDFDKIPGGRGIKFVYDSVKNVFMVINRFINFGFIWDGISGIIGIFNIETGATFVINVLKKVGGFVGYLLQDVSAAIKDIINDTNSIGKAVLSLVGTVVRLAIDNVKNLIVNIIDLVQALLGGVGKSLQTILGPLHDVVMGPFRLLFSAVGKLVDGINNGIMAILQPILGTIRAVTKPLVDIFTAVLRFAGGIFDNSLFKIIGRGLYGVLNIVGGVVEDVKTVAAGVVDGLFKTLSGAISGVGSIFKNVTDAIGSVFGKKKTQSIPYTDISTVTIDPPNKEPVYMTYGNNAFNAFQHFIKEGDMPADLVISYNGGKDNFIGFYDKLKGAAFIICGNTGHIGVFDMNNGAGIYVEAGSSKAYVIDLVDPGSIDFKGPTAKDVTNALTTLNRALDKFSKDLQNTVTTATFDLIEVMEALTLNKLLSSVLSGDILRLVNKLVGNLLKNLTTGIKSIFKPASGVVNVLISLLLNLPENLINGIIGLLGSVVKLFVGLFTPDFVAEMAKKVVISAVKGFTTPIFAAIVKPIELVSTAVLATLGKALDLLKL